MTNINAALSAMTATQFINNGNYWSSSEYSSYSSWSVSFADGFLNYQGKDFYYRVRFVRDLPLKISLKDKLAELEAKVDDVDKKVYVWNVDLNEESGTVTQEEYDAIAAAGIISIDSFATITTKLILDTVIILTFSDGIHLYVVSINRNLNWTLDVNYLLITDGDGTQFLSNDGTYKEISGDSSSGGGGAYAEVNHGTSDTTFTLTPNTFHVWDEVASIDLSFGAETSGVANEYLFQFTSGATATTLTLPSDIKWANDTAPTIAENMIYQISVLKGLASVLEFENSSSLFPVTIVVGTTNQTNIDVYNYLYTTYGEVTTTITEELYFDRDGAEVSVSSIEYGTYEGLTGYWLNGYNMMTFKQVLTSDGTLTQRYPTNMEN